MFNLMWCLLVPLVFAVVGINSTVMIAIGYYKGLSKDYDDPPATKVWKRTYPALLVALVVLVYVIIVWLVDLVMYHTQASFVFLFIDNTINSALNLLPWWAYLWFIIPAVICYIAYIIKAIVVRIKKKKEKDQYDKEHKEQTMGEKETVETVDTVETMPEEETGIRAFLGNFGIHLKPKQLKEAKMDAPATEEATESSDKKLKQHRNVLKKKRFKNAKQESISELVNIHPNSPMEFRKQMNRDHDGLNVVNVKNEFWIAVKDQNDIDLLLELSTLNVANLQFGDFPEVVHVVYKDLDAKSTVAMIVDKIEVVKVPQAVYQYRKAVKEFGTTA